MKTEIINAKIKSTMLGTEDHGLLTGYLFVEGPGWDCGFGGYAFDQWSNAENRRYGTGFGTEFIAQVLKVVGVDKWEALPGKYIRIETEGWGGRILRIGNILEDKWFDPGILAEEML